MSDTNYLKMMLEDFKRIFNSLDLGQKFGLITLVGITLIAATYFVFKMSQPNWVVLYSDLSQTDAQSVVEGLKKGSYPYKISSDKSAILVPQNMQDDLRIYVAENNLIQDSNPGFELLDEMQLGSTDFKNELTKQRIYQGELTRSIEKMSGIKKARVQLAQPERSIFTDSDEAPSASVMLILDGGYKLKSSQVKAIKNLVAYAIPRMKPEFVFITDQNGNNLADDVTKNSNDIETFKANFEAQTAKKIQNVLEKIVGRGNLTVSVSADIDFNSAQSTIESYIPVDDKNQNGVLVSEQTESEIYEKPLKLNEEVPQSQNQETIPVSPTQEVPNQANQNVLPEENKTENVKNLNYTKTKSHSVYNVSKEVKQIVYAPGNVKRMTIAVAVNKILTTEEKRDLENLIMTASGADLRRGDVVSVTSMQFLSLEDDAKQNQKLQKEIEQDQMLYIVFNKVLPLLVVLILGLSCLFVFKSLFNRLAMAREYQGGWSSDGDVEYQHSLQDNLDDMLEVDELPQIEARLDPEIDQKKSDITETILADPKEATRLLISYIKD